jgi:hypothetical protein
VALVHNYEIEIVARVVLEQLLAVEFFVEVLVVREEDLADLLLALSHHLLVDHDALVRRERRECAPRLVLKVVPVGEEQDVVVGEGAVGGFRSIPRRSATTYSTRGIPTAASAS